VLLTCEVIETELCTTRILLATCFGAGSFLGLYLDLKMEEMCSSETSTNLLWSTQLTSQEIILFEYGLCPENSKQIV
jgi:hypothetical protein